MIEVKNLQKSFGKLEILKGIDLNIHKGEVVVVIGPSGSGKSTFLRCLNLLEQPTGGEISFEGQSITAKKHDINVTREKMGMVFQQFNLFPHKSVLQNIMLAPLKVRKQQASEAEKSPRSCSAPSALRTSGMRIRPSSPADRSSGSRLPGRWRCSRM